mmetsp:Transcript_19938/g.70544  ORF Transcript_19938/g.70544 Transcript_19938/m.70544 type:complete len:221 (-) Transcript_19938:998-1660(-)
MPCASQIGHRYPSPNAWSHFGPKLAASASSRRTTASHICSTSSSVNEYASPCSARKSSSWKSEMRSSMLRATKPRLNTAARFASPAGGIGRPWLSWRLAFGKREKSSGASLTLMPTAVWNQSASTSCVGSRRFVFELWHTTLFRVLTKSGSAGDTPMSPRPSMSTHCCDTCQASNSRKLSPVSGSRSSTRRTVTNCGLMRCCSAWNSTSAAVSGGASLPR